MTNRLTATLLTLGLLGCNAMTMASPAPGAPAPGFSGVDSQGNTIDLSDFAGKRVILEWTNHDCPYVKKHYETDTMQQLQRDMTSDDVVWVTVISSAPGKQGYVSASRANELTDTRDAAPTHVILDPEGTIGRSYDARTTPHMFLIDEEQTLQYMGAIDDKPSARHSTVNGAKAYVRLAYAEVESGAEVSEPSTRPYGCSVKY
ncbi:MAG: redoxin family protein [Pseudomonadota bacterium]